MGRNTDPVCKQCRREGVKLYLKGSKCDTKCILDRRQGVLPGMHGYRRPKRNVHANRHQVAEPMLPLFESGLSDLAEHIDEALEGFGER